jgi:hypothetical protein
MHFTAQQHKHTSGFIRFMENDLVRTLLPQAPNGYNLAYIEGGEMAKVPDAANHVDQVLHGLPVRDPIEH